jgi:NAD+ synthase
MHHQNIVDHITLWLKDYLAQSKLEGFVVGVSGGVDSALTATLAAKTGCLIVLVNMPIFQSKKQFQRSSQQIEMLKKKYSNVKSYEVDLSPIFNSMIEHYPKNVQDPLSMANARARLRMTTLYTFASSQKLLVAGTGNKVEDFGVGFYTKYGDGGVDVSPIADLMKTEVFSLAKHLNVLDSILQAKPTDGLWGDDRSDEDQLGATYPELEWAMKNIETDDKSNFSERQLEVLSIYKTLNKANRHKMIPIPVCEIPESYK